MKNEAAKRQFDLKQRVCCLQWGNSPMKKSHSLFGLLTVDEVKALDEGKPA